MNNCYDSEKVSGEKKVYASKKCPLRGFSVVLSVNFMAVRNVMVEHIERLNTFPTCDIRSLQ